MAVKTTVNKFAALAIVLIVLGFASIIGGAVLYERKEAGLAITVFAAGAMACVIGLVIGDVVGKVVMADDAMPHSESTSASK
jgi:uncharacterized protein YybS (DUF2232 family)